MRIIISLIISVIGLVSSDIAFASCTASLQVNGIIQPETNIAAQLARTGTTINVTGFMTCKETLSVTSGDIISVIIPANEKGISIPENVNTRLIIKG